MRFCFRHIWFFSALLLAGTLAVANPAAEQSGSGTIQGVVTDQSGAVVPGAKVEISYPANGFHRETLTGAAGDFIFRNVPFNPYHMVVTAGKFAPYVSDIEVRATVPVTLQIALKIEAETVVTVESGPEDLIENQPTSHTDIDRGLFEKMPLQSTSSSLSSVVTQASPGAAADSNGQVHGVGDHASTSYSVDGQPISDQTSKIFSNQLPVNAVQSLEVIPGAPPAEFGDKTSLVVKVTTRSGLGANKRTGSITSSYGTFGTINTELALAQGNDKWGNFFAADGLNTGRFLDPPEFQVIHARGNQQNGFDRLDFQPSVKNSFHLNGGFTRSWFQTPNSFDEQDSPNGPQDQRTQIRSYNVAPSWTRLINESTVFTLGGFARYDDFHYYPSNNPLADLTETASQHRSLINAGFRADVSYVKGIHNLKIGGLVQNTFLNENFHLGLTDPTVNDPCITVNAAGAFVPAGDASITDPTQCAGNGFQPNIAANPNAVSPFVPLLGCFDLTRPAPAPGDGCPASQSSLFGFSGYTVIKEYSTYVQDAITAGNWTFNLGVRGDWYRGLSHGEQPEPRGGVSYNFKNTHTVLRVSYARLYETPFNENLIVSSAVNNPVIAALFGQSTVSQIEPGQRNEFHAGFEQAFGKFVVVNADYIWKYTRNAYDFNDLLNTPIFFPIAWHNSKIVGPVARISVPNYRGISAFTVLGSVSARFFDPQVGGLGVSPATGVFRIDHDQTFQQTTHVQYQPWKKGPWLGFNWRYDSGFVAGAVPFAINNTTPVNLTVLTADQQIQAGLFCGNVRPTLTMPLITCAPSQYGSTLISLPAPGTQNDDRNPARIAGRNQFDASVGDDNLFRSDRYKWSLRLTAVNMANKTALYNFLSTFSGTHYVSPRAATAELGFHF